MDVNVTYVLSEAVRDTFDPAKAIDSTGRAALDEAVAARRDAVKTLTAAGHPQPDSPSRVASRVSGSSGS